MASSSVMQDATSAFNAPVADATPVPFGTHHTISFEGIFDLSSLTNDEFKKICFLLTPFVTDDDCHYVLNQNILPNKKMQYLLAQVCKRTSGKKYIDYGLVICELLYLIKQYRLLKLLPSPITMCRHKAKVEFADAKTTNIVPKFWRFMFKLCESLDDAEVAFLNRQFCGVNSGIQTAEDLMKHLVRNQVISDSNLDPLERAFEGMNRTDLIKLIQGTRSYPTSCGLAVIFNHYSFKKPCPRGSQECRELIDKDRLGTNVDAESLSALWKKFGLEVQLHKDKTSTELHSILDEISKNDFPMDVFVCCILTHGDEGFIYTSDRVCIPLEAIYFKFGTSKKLEGKPKLFFTQACQGQLCQGGLGGRVIPESMIQRDGPSDTRSHPLYSDMLMGVSTIPGFVSYRSTTEGSYYIQHLVRTLDESWDTKDINEILIEVNRKVAGEVVKEEFKQMPTVRHQLRSKLYFKKEQAAN